MHRTLRHQGGGLAWVPLAHQANLGQVITWTIMAIIHSRHQLNR